MRKRRTNHYTAKRRSFNTELKQVREGFPKDAFDKFFSKDHVTVPFAVYSALLEVLKTQHIYVNMRTEFGRMEKQEISGANIERFCRDFERRVNPAFLLEFMPEMGHVIIDALFECDDVDILEFITSGRKKAVSKVIMTYLRESKHMKDIVTFIKSKRSKKSR